MTPETGWWAYSRATSTWHLLAPVHDHRHEFHTRCALVLCAVSSPDSASPNGTRCRTCLLNLITETMVQVGGPYGPPQD